MIATSSPRPSLSGLLLLVLLLLSACAGERPPAALQVERDTVGDTVIVRTLAGSVWGGERTLEPETRIGTFEGRDVYMFGDVTGFAVAPDGAIYVYDGQVPALRKYAADGTYLATFGREGSGPGEYSQSDGGLAVLPDGRVLLRDPGNARINVYSPTGEALAHWGLRGGAYTSRRLHVDTGGHAYTQIWGRTEAGEDYDALLRYSAAGERLDSLLAPEWVYEPPTISGSGEGIRMINSVPFSPTGMWTLSPHGYLVGGLATRYAIELFRTDGTVLRIEREVEPVPVQAAEKEDRERRATAGFRRMLPDWKWNGPAIPDRKPPFTAIHVGRDGRIWVQVSRPGVEIPADPERPDESEQPKARWREPVVYDAFEPDGTYLGRVHTPHGFASSPPPLFDGDRVWAVTKDDLDVQYLNRFRLAGATGTNPH